MHRTDRTRREFITATTAVSLGVSGCLDAADAPPADLSVPGTGQFSWITIPGGIARLLLVDAQAVRDSPSLQRGAHALLSAEAYRELPVQIRTTFAGDTASSSGFDRRRVGTMAFFSGTIPPISGDAGQRRGPATLFWADRTLESLLEDLDDAHTTEEYRGQTLHVLEDGIAAVLITDDVVAFEASVFAVGDIGMLRSIIENWQGAELHHSDDYMYGVFEEIPEAPATAFSMVGPSRDCTGLQPVDVDTGPVTHVGGYLDTPNSDPVTRILLTTRSPEEASGIRVALNSQLDSDDRGTIGLARDGATVTISYDAATGIDPRDFGAAIDRLLCRIPTVEFPN